MTLRHPLMWVLGFTVFAVNPAVGCSSSPDAEFEYGEAEMLAAVQGTWQLTFERPEGTSTVTFSVERGAASNGALAAPPGFTPQCVTRTFTRPAAACSPSSDLALAATVIEAQPSLEAADGKGQYSIGSVKYVGGRLWLRFGSSLDLEARLDANNAVRDSFVKWQGAPVGITAALSRIATN
jgi:hypothetical protein